MRDLSKRVPIRGRGYSLVSQACGPLSCYMYALVCETTKDAAVIDPSFVNPTEFQALTDLLEKKGANLKHVLLTHGHPDHVIGVDELMNTWPEASLHLHPMEDENYRRSREMGFEFGLRLPDTPLPIPTHELQDGGVVTIGDSIELSVVHTPGHSPGHVSFIDQRCFKEPMKDGNNNITNNHNKPVSVMISGDLLFQGGVGRTDFHNSSLDDLYASIRRLYDIYDDKSIVLSGHTTPTYLEKERLSNPFVDMALKRPQEWYDEVKERYGWS